jgi:hypothetical protein
MLKNTALHPNLQYLYKTPKILNWKIVAGPPGAKLSPIQQYDLIYDEKDLKWKKNEKMIDLPSETIREKKRLSQDKNSEMQQDLHQEMQRGITESIIDLV